MNRFLVASLVSAALFLSPSVAAAAAADGAAAEPVTSHSLANKALIAHRMLDQVNEMLQNADMNANRKKMLTARQAKLEACVADITKCELFGITKKGGKGGKDGEDSDDDDKKASTMSSLDADAEIIGEGSAQVDAAGDEDDEAGALAHAASVGDADGVPSEESTENVKAESELDEADAVNTAPEAELDAAADPYDQNQVNMASIESTDLAAGGDPYADPANIQSVDLAAGGDPYADPATVQSVSFPSSAGRRAKAARRQVRVRVNVQA